MGTPNRPLKFHPEILSPAQRKALPLLAPVATKEGFHLAGGTALALRLGHRRSVDFDWFREKPLTDPLALAARLRDHGVPFTTGQTDRGTLHGEVPGVKVGFIEFRYPLLRRPTPWKEAGILLVSLEDVAAMKLAAIAQRGSRKEFLDLYFIGEAGFTLRGMLDLYRRRFAVGDVMPVLYGLAYFDDAERERMPVMARKIDWGKVKRTIQAWVRDMESGKGSI